jgi:hypothetical protein
MEKDHKKAFRLVDPEGGLPEIYSNHVALGSTRDDIRIQFGQIIPLKSRMVDAAFERPEGNAKDLTGVAPGVVAERVAVTVSYPQAERLSQLLADAVSEGRKQPTTPHEKS